MSRTQIALALAVSVLVAVAALALVAGGDESTPGDGGDAAAAAEPEPETVRHCRTNVGVGEPGSRKRAWVAGPLALHFYPERRPKHFRPDAEIKAIAVVRAGASVTLAVPEAERQRLSLLYDFGPGPRRDFRLSDGTSSVRFSPCPRSGAEYTGPGGYVHETGRETSFNGGFFVRDAHCAAIEVWIGGRATPIRRWLPLGVANPACPP
jgi:hypothetical protein